LELTLGRKTDIWDLGELDVMPGGKGLPIWSGGATIWKMLSRAFAQTVTAAETLSGPVLLKRVTRVLWEVNPTALSSSSRDVERTMLCAAEVLQAIIVYNTL
jgi:hypothetical protein